MMFDNIHISKKANDSDKKPMVTVHFYKSEVDPEQFSYKFDFNRHPDIIKGIDSEFIIYCLSVVIRDIVQFDESDPLDIEALVLELIAKLEYEGDE